jgi:Ankyrin repeats (3 copies)/NACHT domain
LIRIRRWLSAPDPSLNHQKALKQHLQNTGVWFLGSEQYKRWKTDAASFLWLQGIPGCGKTILSSAIIQNILQDCHDDPTKVVAYWYFAFNDSQKQTADLMVKSLITQLSQCCIEIPTALKSLYSSSSDGERQPSLDALLQVLRQMIQDFPASFVVLDALDECNDRVELLQILETMAGWQLESLHVIVTSRNEADIRASMDCHIPGDSKVSLQSKLVDGDICNYVLHRLSHDKNLQRWRKQPEVQQEIKTVMMEKACGMCVHPLSSFTYSVPNNFGHTNRWRWAACQLDTLGKCLNRSMLQKSLRNLPETLDETYERILRAVDEEYHGYASCILQWLAFSTRPLRMEEVAEIVAITLDGTPMFDKDQVLADPSDVLRICSSLVIIVTRAPDAESDDEYDDESDDKRARSTDENASNLEENITTESNQQYLALAHYSVKEYLVSERIQKSTAAAFGIQEGNAHRFIAKSCLVYLLRFQEPHCINENNFYTYKLARYAAEFWIEHTQAAEAAEQDTEFTYQLVRELFTPANSAYVHWLRIYDPDYPWKDVDLTRTLNTVPGPLYYASLVGLPEMVRLLIDDPCADVNTQGGRCGNALKSSSTNGHENIVKLLLEAGADVNAQDEEYSTALQSASANGHENVVKLLLEAGADVNAQDEEYSTALQRASANGHENIVKLLLEAGADVNAQHAEYGTALQRASANGHENVVKLLLEAGADVNAQDEEYSTALQRASAKMW